MVVHVVDIFDDDVDEVELDGAVWTDRRWCASEGLFAEAGVTTDTIGFRLGTSLGEDFGVDVTDEFDHKRAGEWIGSWVADAFEASLGKALLFA